MQKRAIYLRLLVSFNKQKYVCYEKMVYASLLFSQTRDDFKITKK